MSRARVTSARPFVPEPPPPTPCVRSLCVGHARAWFSRIRV